jgi:lipoprotein-anchoring transpeptidase ErfK/SrfK
MSTIAFRDALPRVAPRLRVGWQPVRRTLVIASLAVSISVFVTAKDAAFGIAAPAHPAIAAAPSASPSSRCEAPNNVARAISRDELALPGALGLRTLANGDTAPCTTPWFIPTPDVAAPTQRGQVILVSLAQQWLWAYQDGQLVYATPVTTGQPDLRTPAGTFHVTRRLANTTFYSPWPKGSPYYYTPLHINYALLFRDGGFYIHDAPWRQMFGPSTQDPHQLPSGGTESGSHGCVNVTTAAGAWLYQWVHVGALVVIA